MLRRQRQIRARFYRIMDAGLFALSFWVAHLLRQDNASLAALGGPVHIQKFAEYAWLLVAVVPLSPLLLEMQGFYSRPLMVSRRRTAWQLFQSCALIVLVVV